MYLERNIRAARLHPSSERVNQRRAAHAIQYERCRRVVLSEIPQDPKSLLAHCIISVS